MPLKNSKQKDEIYRGHLIKSFHESESQLCWITGPHGAGKTTLLQQCYNKESKREKIWLDFASSKNSSCNSLSCLENSILQIKCDKLTDLFIDNISDINSEKLRRSISLRLLSLPDNVRIFVCSRQFNLPDLYKAQLSGKLYHVSYAQIKFTSAETELLFKDHLDSFATSKLHLFTDGWAAGLAFLKEYPEVTSIIVDSSTSDMCIPNQLANYLDDVICSQLTKKQLNLLMDFSLTAGGKIETFIDMPRPKPDWGLLDNLLREGLLLDYSSPHRDEISMPPIFAWHLKKKLQLTNPERFYALGKYAANWLNRADRRAKALQLAVSLKDNQLTDSLINDAMDLRAESDPLNFHKITPEIARKTPLLCLTHIYEIACDGKIIQAEQELEKAKTYTNDFDLVEDPEKLHEVKVLSRIVTLVISLSKDIPLSLDELSNIQLETSPYFQNHPSLYASMCTLLAMGYIEHGRFDLADALCHEGLSALSLPETKRITVFLLIHQADIAIGKYNIQMAIKHIEEAYRIARIDGSNHSYEVVTTRLIRAVYHYECNEIDAAEEIFSANIGHLMSMNGWMRLYSEVFHAFTSILSQRGKTNQALDWIQYYKTMANTRNLPRLMAYLSLCELQVYIISKSWSEALHYIDSPSFTNLVTSRSENDYDYRLKVAGLLHVARLMSEIGRPSDALAHLEKINLDLLERNDNRLSVEYYAVNARINFAMRRYSKAAEYMGLSLKLGLRGKYTYRMLLEHQNFSDIYAWMIRSKTRVPKHVSGYFAAQPPAESSKTPRQPRMQMHSNFTLSPRESEIISLIAEGYITKEIAIRLGITEGTVKSYRKTIYKKLGVFKRSTAIAKARELLIL